MVPSTTVRTRKGQHVVGLPAAIARHLVIARGARVYWGMPRAGQALLSVKPRAGQRSERREENCPSCAAYRKEIEQLRARLADRPLRVLNQGVAQGWAQAQHHLGVTSDKLDAIVAGVEDIRARLPFTRRARRPRVPHAVETAAAAGPADSPPAAS
jgi:hypothetical protein